MSCERCKDIHKAQVEGRTQKECGCNCHNAFYAGTSTGNTFSVSGIDTSTTFTGDTTGWTF